MTKKEAVDLLISKAQKWYKAGYRPYHNFHHAMDVYMHVKKAAPDNIAMQLAALYHDAVYIVGRKDNEELSAHALHNDYYSYLHNKCNNIDMGECAFDRACDYITSTKITDHLTTELVASRYIPDTNILLDADLSSLGYHYDVFTYNQFNILQENHLDITNKMHIQKQVEFLNKLSGSRDNIFRTKEYIHKYEQQARDNINRFTKENT